MARAVGLVLMFLVAPFVGVMGLLFLRTLAPTGFLFGGFLLIPLAWVLGITGLALSKGWSPRKTTFAVLGVAGAFIGGIVGSALILPPIVVVRPGDLVVSLGGIDEGSCVAEYSFSFGLANFGGAGFVNVQFLIDESGSPPFRREGARVMGNTTFFVPALSGVWVNPTWLVNECFGQSTIPAVQIASVWK